MTPAAWNPWRGCIKVSDGCKRCYVYTQKRRSKMPPDVVYRNKDDAFNAPLAWTGSNLITVCRWSDFFIKKADSWRNDAWSVIRRTPQHAYLILTKRPELIAGRLPADWGDGWPNVWLGVSVENQEMADKRVSILLKCPATIRFVSCEPLLGPINLNALSGGQIHWVTAGGESAGASARCMKGAWVRHVKNQCQSAKVPFYFSQWGDYHPGWASGTTLMHYRHAGRLLDGRTWDEMPEWP